jgi:phospholipid/cholesterol/gamma-HCH transport system substrate-binding protein
MERTAHYFIVGLFVTATLLALVIFLIWLAGARDQRSFDMYTVEFRDSISGLEEGSNVQYKGVKVGKVMKLRLVPADNELVLVDIGVDKETPVNAETNVTLEAQGITGLVRLEMSTANENAGPPPQREGYPHPVLQGKGSRLYKALEDIPAITEQVLAISEKLNKFLDDPTLASLRQTVLNAETMSRDLNGVLSRPNVANISMSLDNLAESSEQFPALAERFTRAAQEMESAAGVLNGILSRNRGSINRFASEGLSQITAASREARGTALSLRGLADKLKDDPSQLLYQPNSRGVEIPK